MKNLLIFALCCYIVADRAAVTAAEPEPMGDQNAFVAARLAEAEEVVFWRRDAFPGVKARHGKSPSELAVAFAHEPSHPRPPRPDLDRELASFRGARP